MELERLRRSAEGGTSVLVATVDGNGVPACCRAICLRSGDDFETLTVYVPVATGQETVANLATTRRIAVAASQPISHECVQVKGVMHSIRIADESERTMVRERLEALADVLDQIGLPRRVTLGIAHWPAFAIEMSVEQTFDQTPGPNAGNALR